MAQFLLVRGVRPDRDGCILQDAAAAYHDWEELVQLLLEAGADVNAQGEIYGNALNAARKRSQRSCNSFPNWSKNIPSDWD